MALRRKPRATARRSTRNNGAGRGFRTGPADGSFARPLLRWFLSHRRDLPWRSEPGTTANPYHVLVSEAMLQQTQVATVIPYYHRFLRALPTIRRLAAADEQRVLHLWQGLGYYRRARHLHAAAQRVCSDHGGKLPSDAASLRRLPGIGRYTAGAIASIAFARPEPLVDGNVSRVLARLFAIPVSIDSAAGIRRAWSLAETIIDRAVSARVVTTDPATPRRKPLPTPGDLNQALMELGAMVCTPRDPMCGDCPLRGHCAAYRAGSVDGYPVRSTRAAPIDVAHRILAIGRRGRLLVRQRPTDGLWGGLWELPTMESDNPPGDRASIAGLRRFAVSTLGVAVARPRHLGSFTHATTHRRITFELFVTAPDGARRSAGPPARGGPGRWVTVGQAERLPMANPQRRALGLIRDGGTGDIG